MKLRLMLSCVVFFLASFVGVAIASAQSDQLSELAKPVLEAVLAGDYALATALGVVLVVSLLRRYGGQYVPVLAHPLVAPILVLLASVGGSIATSAAAGAAVGMVTVWMALKTSLFSAAGYALTKPYFEFLEGKAPAWLKPLIAPLAAILRLVFKARREAAAKRAGDAAVAANPAEGANVAFKDYP